MADYNEPVPLLNQYKYGLVRRRLLAVITGGLNIRKVPWTLHLIQITLWLAPLFLSVPFIVVDSLRLWNEYYTALVYAITVSLYSLLLEVAVVTWRHLKGGVFLTSQFDDEQDDVIEFNSYCSRAVVDFIFSSKRLHSLFLTPLVTGLLSFATCHLLLPSVLLENLPVSGVVFVSLLGWPTGCIACYSLCVRAPAEVAVYRATDPLELRFIAKPFYIIGLAVAFIVIRCVVVSPVVYLQVIYSLLCLLPLAWTLGVLPPIEALLSWGLEQVLTRLLGGPTAATDLRLLFQFVFSVITVVIVSVLPTPSSSLLLSTALGFALSHNLPHLLHLLLRTLCPCRKLDWASAKLLVSLTGIDCVRVKQLKCSVLYWCVASVRSGLLLGIALLVVYFTWTASDPTVPMNILGGVLLGVYVLVKVSDQLQTVYLCGVIRNPLFPWVCDNIVTFKTKRKLLQYCALPRAIGLHYVLPFLLLAYTGLIVSSELSLAPSLWAWIAISRLLRLVWQETIVIHRDLSLIALLHFVVPQLDTTLTLGPATQALIFGEGLNILCDFIHKVSFVITLFASLIFSIKHRPHKVLTVGIFLLTIFFLPLIIVLILLTSVMNTPLLSLFTLPVFTVGFPRPKRFWPALLTYGEEYSKSDDSIYYQQCTDEVAMALHRSMSSGAISSRVGNQILVRFQDRTIFCSVLEAGYGFKTIALRGLELQETSCHTAEVTKIDEIFESVYDPSTIGHCKFLLNGYFLNTMQPRDAAVIKTYSDAKNVLTGIIDQSSSLVKFSHNLLQTLTWIFYHHYRLCPTPPPSTLVTSSTRITSPTHVINSTHVTSFISPLHEPSPPLHTLIADDNDSWGESVSSHDDDPPPLAPMDRLTTGSYITSNSPLHSQKVEDLFVSPSEIELPSLPTSGSTTGPARQRACKISPVNDHVIPSNWNNVPLSAAFISTLLEKFPSEWYSFISAETGGLGPTRDNELMKIVMVCFSLVDVPSVSSMTGHCRETTSFDLYKGFLGEFPYSAHLSWLLEDPLLTSIVLKAYRYSVKLLYDEASLGEMETFSELAEALGEFDSECFIAPQSGEGWTEAVLNQVPRLFSIARSEENNVYTARVLTLQDQVIHIGELNPVGVASVWADLSLELYFLTNDDEERYSIQAHTGILRNLTIQTADPPLGYSVYAAGLLNIPSF